MHRSTSKIGYSQSFANCLDTCPKCGQNVCEHTSLADVIHLPNSISQDFSTYSSDSSLIKQLFSDSTHSTTAAQQFTNSNKNINFSRLSINTLNNYKNLKTNNGSNFYLSQHKESMKNLKNKNEEAFKENQQFPSFTNRPISCQILSIDNETTDKLLREFFNDNCITKCAVDAEEPTLKRDTTPPKAEDFGIESEIIENLTKLTKLASEKSKNQKKKKTKFSNFRLFLKSGNKSEAKSSKTMRTRGLVNCLTSSASSSASSCEELRQHQRMFLKNKKSKQQNSSPLTSSTENGQTTDDQKKDTLKLKSALNYLEEEKLENLTDFKIKLNKTKQTDDNDDDDTSLRQIDYTKSVFSINSKISNYLCEMDDYNEARNLERCPIVVNDEDLGDANEANSTTNSNTHGVKKENDGPSTKCNCKKQFCSNNNVNSNNFNNNNIVTNHNNTTNINNISSIISVPLNNFLFYNYERKSGEEQSGKNNDNNNYNNNGPKSGFKTSSSKVRGQRPKSSTSNDTIITGSDTTIVNSEFETKQKSTGEKSNSHNKSQIRTLNLKKMAPIEKMSNIISSTDYVEPTPTEINDDKFYKEFPTCKAVFAHKNQLSYFGSCSSLDQSLTLTTTTDTTQKSAQNTLPKYHSVSVIFILIALFTINSVQEAFMLFYYFSTEQTYWFIFSLIGIFCGQFLTLVITLLADIDLINLTPPVPSFSLLSSVSSNFNNEPSLEPTTTNSKEAFYGSKKPDDQANKDQNVQLIHSLDASTVKQPRNQDIYMIFQNPLSKLCLLLVPGYLPLSVYFKFFKHIFLYRRRSGRERFKLEFQLSLHQFFNAIFYSLPLVLINACYLATTTTTRSLNWYYAEFYSFFSIAANYFSSKSMNMEPNLEKRNQLVLFLVSIFISISIGVCLFTTYYELMKQINYLSVLTFKPIFGYDQTKKQNVKAIDRSKLLNLGLVEILVFFCYKFCLITSRVAVISLFWYLFREWVGVAVFGHIFFLYLTTMLTMNINDLSTPDNKHHEIFLHKNTPSSELKSKRKGFEVIVNSSSELSSANETVVTRRHIQNKKSRLKQHLILFITCLLSFVDLFMNQLSEIFYIRKIIGYYAMYFIQNMIVLTYWLVKVVLSNKVDLKRQRSFDEQQMNETTSEDRYTEEKSKLIMLMRSHKRSEEALSWWSEYLTPLTCYASLIYLCIVLFTVFGLVLKFLHLHILRKRYRRIYS